MNASNSEQATDPGTECRQAIELAGKLLAEQVDDSSQLKLIEAVNPLVDQDGQVAPGLWRLTYKARNLIPTEPNRPIGAGGEVFVEVDLAAGTAKISGYGE